MIKRICQTLAVAGAVLMGSVGLPGAAQAQAKFELTPFVGSFYPLAKLCEDCNNANDSTNYVGRQLNSFALGGGVSYWVSRTIGIAATAAWSPSRVEEAQEDTSNNLGIRTGTSIKGTVFLVNGRVMFRPPRTNVHFMVGGGIVKRGGDFWKFVKDSSGAKTTTPMGILGVGVRASVTPKFSLDINAEGHFYSFDPRFGVGTDPSNGTKLQTDLMLTVGVPIALSK